MKQTLLVLLVLALAGCPVASVHRPEVELRLAASPALPRAGDTLRLTATLANPHAQPVEVEGFCSPAVVFRVTAADRSRVAHRTSDPWPCGVAGARYRIAPGDSVRFSDRWVADSAGAFHVTAAVGEHYVTRGGNRAFKMGHGFAPVVLRVAPR